MRLFNLFKPHFLLWLLLFAVGAAYLLYEWLPRATVVHAQTAVEHTTITIRDTVLVPEAKRLGVNIGAPNPYGAAHYLRNAIMNPGFEAGEFATVFLVDENATVIDDGYIKVQQDNWDTAWNSNNVGQPEGFWVGAEYEIVYGPAVNQQGEVVAFTHEDGQYTYTLRPNGSELDVPAPGDVIFVRHQVAGFAGAGDDQPLKVADTESTRPDSPGTQSLRLLPPGDEQPWVPSYKYYMDSFARDDDISAGKLILIEGEWHFAVWLKAEIPGEQVRIEFSRQGLDPFFAETVPLDAEWTLYELDFSVPVGFDALGGTHPDLKHPILELRFHLDENEGDVWLDDMVLARAENHANPTAFTDKYVNLLKELNPGILRNWGGQLGSSLDNQLAEPFARRTTGHHPNTAVALDFHYSLPEFLALCEEVGAEPWYVIPPTFSAEEIDNLIGYLAAPVGAHPYANRRANAGHVLPWTDIFSTIHLEYGNEMWGGNDGTDNFIGATMRGGVRLGTITNGRFAIVRENPHFDPERFNLIVGGQFGAPERQGELETYSENHDTVALSPYFGSLESYFSDAQIFYPLFARPLQDVTSFGLIESRRAMDDAAALGGSEEGVVSGAELAVYEINFHTTVSTAPLSTLNGFVTGLNGGLALPLYMLTYQRDLGVRNQAAFSTLQYAYRMANGEYARLWGMLRDIEATGRKRPTWLGVELANRAVMGDMITTFHSGADPVWTQPPINEIVEPIDVPYVQSFAFKTASQYTSILFNLHLAEPQTVVLQLPSAPDSSAVQHTLTSDSIHHNNEASSVVRIRSKQITDFAQEYALTLPPHAMVVVAWGTAGTPIVYEPVPATPTAAVADGGGLVTRRTPEASEGEVSDAEVLLDDGILMTPTPSALSAQTPRTGFGLPVNPLYVIFFGAFFGLVFIGYLMRR